MCLIQRLQWIWHKFGALTSVMFVISASSSRPLCVLRHRVLLPNMLKITFSRLFIFLHEWLMLYYDISDFCICRFCFCCCFVFSSSYCYSAVKFYKSIVCWYLYLSIYLDICIWLIIYLNFASVTLDTCIHVEALCLYNCSERMLQ